jgi:predicted Zn-ribbon and HTH transcriptional regulator
MRKEDIESYLDTVQSILSFQVTNGLISEGDAKEILDLIKQIRQKLEKEKNEDLSEAEAKAREAYVKLMTKINAASRCARLKYMYALHIWVGLFLITLLLFFLLFSKKLDYPIFADIPADVTLWGALGGVSHSIFYLRKNVYELRFSKYYGIYWIAYPMAAAIFGLAVVTIIAAGLLSINAKPGYGVYATLAYLSGVFQEWFLKTLKDIADSIHKTER